MTFEEYETLDQLLIDRRAELHRKFIEANKPCEIGTFVVVTVAGLSTMGIVSGFNISWRKVVPVIKKLKKDGTPSNIMIHIYTEHKITYLNGKTTNTQK